VENNMRRNTTSKHKYPMKKKTKNNIDTGHLFIENALLGNLVSGVYLAFSDVAISRIRVSVVASRPEGPHMQKGYPMVAPFICGVEV
jgi:hypothetical protein